MAPDSVERRSSLRIKNSRERAVEKAQKNKKAKLEVAPPPGADVASSEPAEGVKRGPKMEACGDQEVVKNGHKQKMKKAKVGDVARSAADVGSPETAVVRTEGGEAQPGILESKVEEGGDLKAKVTETLRLYNKHYLYFVQEEAKRCKKEEGEKKEVPKSKAKNKKGGKTVVTKGKKGSKSQDNLLNDDKTKRVAKRPDLKALTKMQKAKEILYPEKRFGAIPGVEVGHQFFSRAEMVATGFHGHWLFGIDYISANRSVKTKGLYKDLKLPIAISIVISGQYEDDVDNSDDVVYTGQGGNNLLGDRRQVKHQIMERGNLGLKLSMEQNVPVRVTRMHKHKFGNNSENNYVGKVYTYDGLYKVVKYWAEAGVSGFTVYKFQLKRIDNQPPLTTSQVYYFRGHVPNTVSEIRGLVCEDISGGLETNPIPATNLVDDPPVAPTGSTYIKTLQISPSVQLPPKAPGCSCQGNCSSSRTCSCRKLNGVDFPYVHINGGRLIEPKAVVFECGSNCGCGPDCINRTSQKRPRYRLEVFRTAKKGWAVRSWDFIQAGAPICEYIGILMKSQDIDTSMDTNYVFDIDCLQTMQGLDGRERRLGDVSLPIHLQNGDHNAGPEFCIDAGSSGNIARFINHSCQPNLFVQCVLTDHHDIRQARVMLFAADNIPPLTELTYDYGYAIDSVVGPDGNIKQMICYCGAANCRRRMF